MSDTNHQDIQAVYGEISRAFNERDIEKALNFFSTHSDMMKISNGHVSRGKQELAAYWKGRLHGAHDVRIEIRNIEIHVIDERHAWATADEYISINGDMQQAIVSNIFLHENSGWRILLDHTSYVDEAR